MNEYKVVFGEWVLEPKIVYINAHSDHEATSIVMDHYNVPKGWIISISLSCENTTNTCKVMYNVNGGT